MKSLLQAHSSLRGEVADARIFNNLAHELLTLRKVSGLTQKQLAEKIDLKQSHISRWERAGYQGYTVKNLSKLARGMGSALSISVLPQKTNLLFSIQLTSEQIETINTIHPNGVSIVSTKKSSQSATINIPMEGVIS